MTLVSELSRMSKGTRLGPVSAVQAAIPRSQSDTSYSSLASAMDKRPRRGSDWSDTIPIIPSDEEEQADHHQTVLRPLQFNHLSHPQEGGYESLLQRRLSRANVTPVSSNNTSSAPSSKSPSSREVNRSQSVKSVKRSVDPRHRHRGSSIPSEVNSACSGVRVKQRTISNRSLPLPGDESEYYRLRNFSITSKGVINRGDSFRSKSTPSVPASISHGIQIQEGVPNSEPMMAKVPEMSSAPPPPSSGRYLVLVVGAPDVGKSSIKTQFMTSEYICAYDSVHEDEKEQAVTVVLNCEESEMEFEEKAILEENTPLTVNGSEPDAFVIVYSVTNRRSYLQARQLLSQVETKVDSKAVILVGNKTDLARLRTVTTEEGRSLAKDKSCKFIETSVAINHNVDELLVGVLTQIRMKAKMADKHKKKRESQGSTRRQSNLSGSKASGVLKRILKRACLKSKSCDNLHVL